MRFYIFLFFIACKQALDMGEFCPLDQFTTSILRVPSNESLEGSHVFNVTCSPDCSDCSLLKSFLFERLPALTFVPTNSSLAPLASSVKPGHFLLQDKDKRCVLLLPDGKGHSVVCPPGFYCAGHDAPAMPCPTGSWCPGGTAPGNATCPKGLFCIMPSIQDPVPCPAGSHCTDNTSFPMPCASGMFCELAHPPKPCWDRHYCPYGSDVPVPCRWYESCGVASPSPSHVAFNAACLVAFLIMVGLLIALRNIAPPEPLVALTITGLIVVLLFCDLMVGCTILAMVGVVSLGYCVVEKLQVKPVVCGIYFRGLGGLFGMIVGILALAFMFLDTFFAICLVLLCHLVVTWKLLTDAGKLQSACGWALLLFPVVAFNVYMLVFSIFMFISGDWDKPIMLCLTIAGLLLASVSAFTGVQRLPALLGEQHGHVRDSQSVPTLSFEAASTVSPEPLCVGSQQELLPGISFQLQNLSFRLHSNDALVLKDLTLNIGSGHRVAIMGPSGCGKTTLLSVLSNRVPYGSVEGQMLINGQTANLSVIDRVVGFVPQDDIMHGELTVYENVYFHACLRLGITATHKDAEDAVLDVLQSLSMEQHKDKMVGTEEARGISGGQRKRVSIAMEMVMRPSLLFLDEPTSGLDSAIALEVVAAFCATAAKSNCTTLAVIHQPRFSALMEFDDVILLAPGGYLVYSGSTQNIKNYFSDTVGVNFPADSNPADILMDCLSGPHALDISNLESSWRSNYTSARVASDSITEVSLEMYYRTPPSWARAVYLFLHRSLLQTWRSRGLVIANLCLVGLGTAMVCMALPMDVDTHNPHPIDGVVQMSLCGLFFMLLTGVGALRIFSLDRVKTWREASSGMSMLAYSFGKDVAALVDISLTTIVFTLTYGATSGMLFPQDRLFSITFVFVWTVYGFAYVCSVSMSTNKAQMIIVFSAFINYALAGTNQPTLLQLANSVGKEGWMLAAISPLRWFIGYMLTQQIVAYVPKEAYKMQAEALLGKVGYNITTVPLCMPPKQGEMSPWWDSNSNSYPLDGGQFGPNQSQWWRYGSGWVCEPDSLFLLGFFFRAFAFVLLDFDARLSRRGWLNSTASKVWGFRPQHLTKMLLVLALADMLYQVLILVGCMRQRAQYTWMCEIGAISFPCWNWPTR